jgi:hypothetical protein
VAALTSAVNASVTRFPTDTVEPSPGYYMIDDEAVRVGGSELTGTVGGTRTVWIVERGYAGTTAASHDSGATLTRYYPEAPSSGGGAVQSISLIDGGVISFDTPGLIDNVPNAYVNLGTVPAGAIVLRVWAEEIATWADVVAGDDYLSLGIGDAAAATGPTLASYDLGQGSHGSTADHGREQGGLQLAITDGSITGGFEAVTSKTESDLWANIYQGSAGEITAGSVHVYALIAQPA